MDDIVKKHLEAQVESNVEMFSRLKDLSEKQTLIPERSAQAIWVTDINAHRAKTREEAVSKIDEAVQYAKDFIKLVEGLDKNLASTHLDGVLRKVKLDVIEGLQLKRVLEYVRGYILPFFTHAKSLDIKFDQKTEEGVQNALIRAEIYVIGGSEE